jgi:hypothetical protein
MNAPATIKTSRDPATIPGWGVDANPKNDPTYPYRDRLNDDHSGQWPRPAVQHSDVEILESIEYVRRPAVFGTSTPPSGLSGMIRRAAFTYSESHWLHWLMLMGADRINVVEGIVSDLAHAKIPNIPAEMGVRAEWQHNKKGLATKVAVTAGLAALTYALIRARRGSGKEERRVPLTGPAPAAAG